MNDSEVDGYISWFLALLLKRSFRFNESRHWEETIKSNAEQTEFPQKSILTVYIGYKKELKNFIIIIPYKNSASTHVQIEEQISPAWYTSNFR